MMLGFCACWADAGILTVTVTEQHAARTLQSLPNMRMIVCSHLGRQAWAAALARHNVPASVVYGKVPEGPPWGYAFSANSGVTGLSQSICPIGSRFQVVDLGSDRICEGGAVASRTSGSPASAESAW